MMQKLENLSRDWEINLYIKREDLTDFYGNKTRHAREILRHLKELGIQEIELKGPGDSNSMRIYAMAAKRAGMKVRISNTTPFSTGNGKIMQLIEQSGEPTFTLHYHMMKDYAALGYIEVAEEIERELPDVEAVYLYSFDASWIGLSLGFKDTTPSIVNVRPSASEYGRYGDEAEKLYLEHLVHSSEVLAGRKARIIPDTATLDGTFEDMVSLALNTEGILLDPVYTGRALKAIERDREKLKGQTVVLIHTGGVFLNV